MRSMLIHPQIDPVALQLGPVAVHWYGLTYLAAFALFLFLGLRRLQHPAFVRLEGEQAWHRQDVEDILFMGVMGVVLGGRVGYCLFYKPLYYLMNPLEILAVWQGGMSFHGGLLGVIVAMLAQLHPLGVPAAAMLVASVFVGADAMSRAFNVPSFIADVMVSLSLLSMMAASFFVSYRVRR